MVTAVVRCGWTITHAMEVSQACYHVREEGRWESQRAHTHKMLVSDVIQNQVSMYS